MGKKEKNIGVVDTGFIRAEVARNKVTYKDLADGLEIGPEELSRKVNDRVAFSVCEIVTLADLLGCSTDKILGRA